MIEFSYTPKIEWIAGLSAGVLLFLWLSYYKAKGKPTGLLKLVLISLRLLAVGAVVICLLDPQWVETVKHEQRSRVAVLLDKSKSMSIEDVGGTRLKSGQKWLSEQLDPLAPAGVTLSTFAFDQGLSALPSVNSANPTGAVTALSESLEGLLAVPHDDPLRGVVVVSDGIDNTTKVPEKVARSYRRKGIPIHTVTVGTTNEMVDVILENVQVKRAVPNEAPTRLSLQLRSPGFAGKTAGIQVRGPKGIVAAQEVKLNGGEQRVELDLTPKDKGFQIYEAKITALKGEWLASNNKRMFGLDVVDPTIRVIYMEGTPQTKTSPMPEWKYLKDALLSDPNISVKVLYRQLGTDGKYLNTIDTDPETGEKIYPVEHPREGFPRTMAGLLEYDVVIHSDIKKESFTPQQLQNIAQLVEQHGGGFVMIGGNSAFGKGGYHQTVLDRIIPVAMEQANDSQGTAFHTQLTRGALAHPLMNIGTTPEETLKIWTSKFPMLYGFNRVDRAKPGAVVLALNPVYDTPYGPGILMAVQDIGKGRSMAFTSDTTRTWGRDFETLWGEPIRPGTALSERNCDRRYYQQFWVNAVRWLANGKLGRTNNPVTFELAQSYCLPGESVAARVKVRDSELRDIANAEVHLTIPSSAGTNTSVRARYDVSAKAYLADIRPAAAGNFIVTASARQGGEELGTDRQLLVAEGTDIEMADLRARPDFMAALAKETKGESFALASGGGISPGYVFAKAPEPKVEFRREPLWDKAIWMSLILGVIGIEWTIRRMRGLA